MSPRKRSRLLRDSLESEFHVKEYSGTEFVQILRDAGFEKVDLFTQDYTPLGRLREEVRAVWNRARGQ